MNIENIKDKLDANVYGEQSIVSDDLANFLWSGYMTYVLGKNNRELYVDRMISGSELTIRNEEDDFRLTGDFDETLDFPYITYIKNDYSYIYGNEVSIPQSYIVSGNDDSALTLIKLWNPSTDLAPSCKLRFDICITDSINTWEYILEVTSTPATGYKYRFIPRKITSTGINLNLYKQDDLAPTFINYADFESGETVTDDTFNLSVFLPASFGKNYGITVTLVDYVNSTKNPVGVQMVGSIITGIFIEEQGEIDLDGELTEEQITNTEQKVVAKLAPTEDGIELPIAEVIENYDDDILVLPDFDVYKMSDLEVEAFMSFLTMVTNMTSDEAQSGSEQYEAFSRFSGDIINFPDKIFKSIPDEFKKSSQGTRRNNLNSGTRLIGRKW